MRLSSAPPAPDLQSSARRREERLALLREESGTWLPKQRTDLSTLKCTAQARARWAAAGAAMQANWVARKPGARS